MLKKYVAFICWIYFELSNKSSFSFDKTIFIIWVGHIALLLVYSLSIQM